MFASNDSQEAEVICRTTTTSLALKLPSGVTRETLRRLKVFSEPRISNFLPPLFIHRDMGHHRL